MKCFIEALSNLMRPRLCPLSLLALVHRYLWVWFLMSIRATFCSISLQGAVLADTTDDWYGSQWALNSSALITHPWWIITTHMKTLSLCFNGLSRWTWVSRCLLKLRMMEVVVTTGAVSRAKLQSNHHHRQTNTQFFTDVLPVAHPTVSKHMKTILNKISPLMQIK